MRDGATRLGLKFCKQMSSFGIRRTCTDKTQIILCVTLRRMLRLIECQADAVGVQELRSRGAKHARFASRILRSEIVLCLNATCFDEEAIFSAVVQGQSSG